MIGILRRLPPCKRDLCAAGFGLTWPRGAITLNKRAMAQATSEGLVRGIRRWDLVAVAINGIIGAGIFGLPSQVAALIGSYSLVAFITCAFVVTLIVLCFAEVS